MERLIRGWVPWAFLYIAVVLSIVCIMVELQNIRSIRDRSRLNAEQKHIRGEVDRANASLRRLEDFVLEIKKAEQRRRQR